MQWWLYPLLTVVTMCNYEPPLDEWSERPLVTLVAILLTSSARADPGWPRPRHCFCQTGGGYLYIYSPCVLWAPFPICHLVILVFILWLHYQIYSFFPQLSFFFSGCVCTTGSDKGYHHFGVWYLVQVLHICKLFKFVTFTQVQLSNLTLDSL